MTASLFFFVALVFFAIAIIESHLKNWVAWGLAFMALGFGALSVLKALF